MPSDRANYNRSPLIERETLRKAKDNLKLIADCNGWDYLVGYELVTGGCYTSCVMKDFCGEKPPKDPLCKYSRGFAITHGNVLERICTHNGVTDRANLLINFLVSPGTDIFLAHK